MSCCSFASRRSGRAGRWKGWEIVAMVAGFIVFWPLGLAMIFYKKWAPTPDRLSFDLRFGPLSRDTGNVAFEAYKADEIRRLEEERRQLAVEQGAFEDFLDDLKRAKDREQFDAYMARRHARRGDIGG